MEHPHRRSRAQDLPSSRVRARKTSVKRGLVLSDEDKGLAKVKKALPRISELAMLGLTNAEIGRVLCVSTATFSNWVKRYPILAETLAGSRDQADGEVAESLHSRAIGYDHQILKRREINGEGEVIKEVYETIHVPPDVAAAKFILTNRHPELWKIKRDSGRQEQQIFGIVINQEMDNSPDIPVVPQEEKPRDSLPSPEKAIGALPKPVLVDDTDIEDIESEMVSVDGE